MIDTTQFTAVERFLRYVQIDTQSDPNSTTVPSTAKQKDLGRVLVSELIAMGIADAEMDDKGYVYATIPATTEKRVPVICFCSHMDTSPDASGKDVKPIVHSNYQGEIIDFPDNPSIQLDPADHPDLYDQIGHGVITASGNTLLGADNKAGVAEIMAASHYLMKHPEIKHGPIRILFTPDEEIGRGADHVDVAKLAADFGYTVDGEKLGSYEDETFSADGAVITFSGVSAHPGFAKGKLINAIKLASNFLETMPTSLKAPEQTSDRESFIHPLEIKGSAEEAKVTFILRSFDNAELERLGKALTEHAHSIASKHLGSQANVEVVEQYRNMKQVIDQHPHVSELALKAIKQAGVQPIHRSIRGGTDGSRLSFMGLPCPNIFAGEHAFHSKLEWVSDRDMNKAVEVILNLVQLWEMEA